MLNYNAENDIMENIYRSYQEVSKSSEDMIHELGSKCQHFLGEYALSDRAVSAINMLASFKGDEARAELENKLVHCHISSVAAAREEEKSYREFCALFEDPVKECLLGIRDHVLGKKQVPYKIKDKNFRLDVINSPALCMSLEFRNVLIEDGRHPHEIFITHIDGGKFLEKVTLDDEDGSQKTIEVPAYRIYFVNAPDPGTIPTKVSSFTFSDVSASINVYNYSQYRDLIDVDADKVQWRLLMQPLSALVEKAEVLGYESLNEEEKSFMPILCVFYEMIEFYLRSDTLPASGTQAAVFSENAAMSFKFGSGELEDAARYMADCGIDIAAQILRQGCTDRFTFCRNLIQYFTISDSENLYSLLMQILSDCASTYTSRILPLPYRKYHRPIVQVMNDIFGIRKWKGTFPEYHLVTKPEFLEVSEVYSKVYTYLNEQNKCYYYDIIESVNDSCYLITLLRARMLLKEEESAARYCALDSCFTDGGRRKAEIAAQLMITEDMDTDQVIAAVEEMEKLIT
ncbi:MAG: hypothetical protein K6F49_01380 [Saccharofermentans sp.]|nr:hypothetical protein [Saccharofermentans sp.]